MSRSRKLLTILVTLFFLPGYVFAHEGFDIAQHKNPPSPPTLSVQTTAHILSTVPLSTVQDGMLTVLLDSLEHERHIVTKDNRAILLAATTPMIAVPLIDRRDRQKTLYLYYLSNKSMYFFLQVGYNSQRKEEARLWTNGPAEILLSEDRLVYLQSQSDQTFRLSDKANLAARQSSTVAPSDLSPLDILSCIAKVFGLSFDPTSLQSAIESASCSTLNVVNLAVLACSCLSIPSAGPGLVFGTIGCVSGIAAYIACGVLNCSSGSGPDLDQQAQQDMINAAAQDARFGSPIDGSFGTNLNWDPNWQLRFMDFNFTFGRTVTMFHVTNTQNTSLRFVEFFDPDTQNWTGWQQVF